MDFPTLQEWKDHAFAKLTAWGDNPRDYTEFIHMKYDYAVENEWNRSVNGKDKPIKRWRAYLTHSLEHRKPNRNQKVVTDPGTKKRLTKMNQIEINDILYYYGEWKDKKPLLPPAEKCFHYLKKKGVFQNPHVISKKTGKPWQEWYNRLFNESAGGMAIAYAIDKGLTQKERDMIRNGKHELAGVFVQIEALKTYFKRFEDRNQLKSALLAL